ncbi:MAG: hypothetical protein IT307_20715, partial [Chloroflexi bacterium]|nr:hypothetical protein [Chloroflexota bacterium]
LALKLYRDHFGKLPVAVKGSSEPLDGAAAWNEKRTALTIGVVNPTYSEVALKLETMGAKLGRSARVWRIAGTDRMAYNHPGGSPQIAIASVREKIVDEVVRVPALSISVIEAGAR